MNSLHHEVNRLVSALVDGVIDDSEFARLNELIETDADARALYIRLMHVHADLPRLVIRAAGPRIADLNLAEALSGKVPTAACQAAGEELAAPAGDRRGAADGGMITTLRNLGRTAWRVARRPTPFSLLTSAVVLGVIIAVMGYLGIPNYRPSGAQSRVVARLTRFCDAQWPPESSNGPGHKLKAGDRVDLRDGLVEVTFVGGSRVLLQGPVQFDAVSANSGHLERGRLTATIPQQAIGFSVTSPSLQLVDLGTEFGMFVDESGATDAHVFDGQVEITAIAGNAGNLQRMTLAKGEATRVTLDGDGFRQPEHPEEQFVRPDEINELIVQREQQRQREFLEALPNDPAVVAFYAFAESDQASGRLVDSATLHAAPYHGRLQGVSWTAGRWEDKRALRFDQPEGCVHFDFGSSSFPELTLAAWLQLDELKHPLNAILYASDWSRTGAAHWTICDDGRIEFAVRGNEPEALQSDATAIQHRWGRWVHVAVVYSARAGTVRFYVNGVLRGSRSFAQAGPAHFRQAQLGNWNQEQRNIVGKMDELLVYRNALNDQEIGRLFTAGRR